MDRTQISDYTNDSYNELTNYLEIEWHNEVYMVFYYKYKHLIESFELVYENPLLLLALLNESNSELDTKHLSENPSLTIDILRMHIKRDWNWFSVSANRSVTMQDIMNHPEYPWEWDGVSYNPNLTISMINQYPNKEW